MPELLRDGSGARRRWVAWGAALAALAGLAVWRPLARGDDAVHEFVGPTMGATFAVSIDGDLSSEERERVRAVIDEQLDRVNRLMSTYDPGSEVSRFNQHQSTEPFAVSPEVLVVLEQARAVSERSGGAFDVTVAPLVDAWGFGATDRAGPIPDANQLASLRTRVGYRSLALDAEAGTVSKSDPAIRIDLSGIAQGYAADAVAFALGELGLASYLVDVGGEIRAVGTRRSGRAWRIGVESPDDAVAIWGTAEIRDEGVATSGDYRNWFEEEGVRYAHIIDPRTGQPIRMRGASVTVIHESASLADAWATALCVLGPDEGYELARREGLAAIFITRSERGLGTRITPAMEGRASAGES
ncbi:MAG: FAD:protein FMN transferase [Longimicrobiales bacterium]